VLDQATRAGGPTGKTELNDVLARSVDFLRSRPEFAGIRFELDLDPGASPVKGSPVMLGQVFLNLVLNACEAQPRGGEVRIKSRRDGSHTVAEIADRGPGIPPEDRARVFEAFHTTKGSTGLGLFICRSIVRQHGAELTVDDREGGGAVFRVRLASAQEAN
jgi:signal transduction histidine kinase